MSDAPLRRGMTIERIAFGCFIVSTLAALALAGVYWAGGQPQAEGALLGTALLGFGGGLILWANALMPAGAFEQHRERLRTTPEEDAALEEAFDREGAVSRRRLLIGGMSAALGAFAAAFAFPIRSLGPSPGNSLARTPWRAGMRAITSDGRPVRAADVPLNGLVTVFPDGFPGSADGQTVLMRVHPDGLHLPRGRSDWTPGGLIAYSKVCTHAGCPVGLFEAERAQLLCPCHQSAFDVLTGANPVFGPAARALPQLPLLIDADGYVAAQSDYLEPIGPSYWNRP
ncbi:MAG: Rieske 2Fe-2S domain-containing protein [Actinomycetota bacterium]|nr:Rieske 2Fe-2S domain-containing protein [Actinomycetota bacterium]